MSDEQTDHVGDDRDEGARLEQAGARWQRRVTEREHKRAALQVGDYVDADTPERLARWVDRHRRWLDVLDPGGDATGDVGRLERLGVDPAVHQDAPLRREDVSNELVERVIGATRDLLSVEFFEMGLLAARCVGLVVTRNQPNGTGFLVAPGLMLTNEHVLRTAGEAALSTLELDFEDNRVGERKQTQVFDLDPGRFFYAHRDLDFALVAVRGESRTGAQLDGYSVLPLIGEEGKVRIGEAVNVVQHPSGRVKQVAIRNNRLVDLPEGEGMSAFFHYEADTEKGSSGSPVFNDFWEVVALHHSAVPATDDQGRLVGADGRPLGAADSSQYVWVANEGIRVSRIVAAVRDADLPPQMHQVRDLALRTWQWRGEPHVAADAPLTPVSGGRATGEQEPAAAAPTPSGAVVEASVESAGAAPAPATPTAQVVEVTVPVRLRITVEAGQPTSTSTST
ncbi:trypsin-like peptidase domain-containing protein [Aquipuribacter sp. MA13-6]|uniref:trypsin-like peptidase domain-containing protein n=1 Tax=unclassified Aquipuribacter TaxID=2635084 RepID=UPI003EEA395D